MLKTVNNLTFGKASIISFLLIRPNCLISFFFSFFDCCVGLKNKSVMNWMFVLGTLERERKEGR